MNWVFWPGSWASRVILQRGTGSTCSWAGGVLLGTVGWSDGSFSLPQDDIDESADQRQGEGHPRQDVGVAK